MTNILRQILVITLILTAPQWFLAGWICTGLDETYKKFDEIIDLIIA